MRYQKKFAGSEELKLFVDFHREETGLIFSFNRDSWTAWIDVDEKVCQQLRDADPTR